jgi:galactokinase
LTNRWKISVPGRVNLIGEHVDYHNLPVLPMAIQRRVTVEFTPSGNEDIHIESDRFGERRVSLHEKIELNAAGDWENYLKAAIQAVRMRWSVSQGFRAVVTSDLPIAAGLSSSSALLTAFALGLLRANGLKASLAELMSVLPEGEHFVGTRGGGMDHAAVLASRAGNALLVHFAPFCAEQIAVPEDWRFLVAHSLVRAEKSGTARARYNACRTAGLSALAKMGLASFQEALQVKSAAGGFALTEDERDSFEHVVSEAGRLDSAVSAMRLGSREHFGNMLNASHASLRDLLRVSCPALDEIVKIANAAGADGARLTGAGFGGCAIILCTGNTRPKIMSALEHDFYFRYAEYNRSEHLIPVEPANGALYETH